MRVSNLLATVLDAEEFYETPVLANSTQTVSLLAFDTIGGAPISSVTLTKTAPKDIVIERKEFLASDAVWNANRVFFLEGGQIITNGNNLFITANKIYIQKTKADIERSSFYSRQINSQILTTIPGTIAPSENHLRGSFVSVKANFAQGHLAILMVGFNGKDGISGLEKEKAHGLSKSSSLLHGTKGEDGEPGGSTGSVSVLIQDHTQFALEIIQKPGAPGKGGLGAPGGPGGMGGPAGANPGAPCVPARNGQNGPTGSSGKDGQDGAPGKVGERITNVNRLTTVELK